MHKHFQPTSRDIFPNTELRLSKVRTYGFDYDYTLARYTDKLPETIYTMIRDVLVKKMLYPPALLELKYDSTFAIRGIVYDKETGWLFKLDSNYNIAMDTIHYGREPLHDLEEVYSLHNGPHVAPDYFKNHLYQLNDIYSVPEATLLADIIQHFSDHNIPFHPRYLAEDIRAAGESIHKGDGISLSPLHTMIMNNIGDYLNRAPELLQILNTLKSEGKRLFLLTNSGYQYVDKGLTYMFNTPEWRDVFDVVIVGARKPGWYLSHRPFRLVPTSKSTDMQPWAPVDQFEDGQVYSGGNLMSFTSITGYSDRNVMYFGDHIYSDLRDPSIQKGWFTGAIVSELKHELSVIQRSEYRQRVSYIQLLEKILKYSQQETRGAEFMKLPAKEKEKFRNLLDVGRAERRRTRWKLRDCFNTNFGSVFRTEKYPSLFATKIKSFANVYTADLSNLGEYPSDFVFYPKRMEQAHETRMPEVDDLLDEILHDQNHTS
ncbi:HAD-superfamily hydrolase [Coemansia reversa NRRL 1564]|uniref:HAD-superfamily hydrolase n=1 Tax=Coemansia reversa (strain ATCC 12441 / NRRL 1564) TaxID=763665 RepID=A0A2G5BCJ3_COERN|nr:HAD-superfamily hydrolase [Coemansia reversa NRRL 1564]|eukprot:PIA16702.1 HAD-superfamily hydrolase [Coemansia reversa NRRL 1564]